MKSTTFLDKLSTVLLAQPENELSSCTIVLPNKRAKVFLLESSEYNKKENSRSFLCFDSLLSFSTEGNKVKTKDYNGKSNKYIGHVGSLYFARLRSKQCGHEK